VEGAAAFVRIAMAVMGNGNVAHFRVEEAVQQTAIHHASPADAGADGQVDERVEPPGRSPALLTEGRGIDISVEAHGHVEGIPDGAG